MSEQSEKKPITLEQLFPPNARVLLTGTGKQFIERIGVEAAREAVLGILMGENIRTQTEPLTRQRVGQISGALVALFVKGCLEIDNFPDRLSEIATAQLHAPRQGDKTGLWLAQWMLGLTGKSVQNVLQSNAQQLTAYLADFENDVEQIASRLHTDLGDLRMSLGYAEDPSGRRVVLGWKEITRLTTAIGSQTLTIRGSDKSMFGKLFERLVLGSLLSILGFKRVNPATNTETRNVFWLSDDSDLRESDATVLLRPGKLARFDIGFIGPGNPEISKDKLSRFAREAEVAGNLHTSATFIIVDRLPDTSKTRDMATKIEADIIQMSMQYWPRELAQKLGTRLGFQHEMQTIADQQIRTYLKDKLAKITLQDFLSEMSAELDEISQL